MSRGTRYHVSITLNNQFISSQDEGPDRLIGALRAWGVEYLLAVADTQRYANNSEARMPAIELVTQLAQCPYPRVRDACLSFFIVHPATFIRGIRILYLLCRGRQIIHALPLVEGIRWCRCSRRGEGWRSSTTRTGTRPPICHDPAPCPYTRTRGSCSFPKTLPV